MARKEFVAGKAAGKQEGYTSTHFTPETAVIDLLKLIPFESGDIALDPSAGVNKVWFNNFPCQKEYCEIEEGTNFFEYAGKCDWIVGNPPFTDFIKYLLHSPSIARKGFAYLISKEKEVCYQLLSIGGYFLHFGWHSNGMGKGRDTQIEELLLVAHGRSHNDTICMAEKKLAHQSSLFGESAPNTAWSRLVEGTGILPAVVNKSESDSPRR